MQSSSYRTEQSHLSNSLSLAVSLDGACWVRVRVKGFGFRGAHLAADSSDWRMPQQHLPVSCHLRVQCGLIRCSRPPPFFPCACFPSIEKKCKVCIWGIHNSIPCRWSFHVGGFFHRQTLFRAAHSVYHLCFTTLSSTISLGPQAPPPRGPSPTMCCRRAPYDDASLLLQTLPKRATSSDPGGSLARQHAAEEDLWAIHLAMRAAGAPDSESR